MHLHPLLLWLPALALQVVHVSSSQQILADPQRDTFLDNSTAPFIFNSLSSLLTQWPNTYHPNGHTIIPGVLEPYTLLYHARKDAQVPPPSPEWFAFDPEMSYGIMASRGGMTFLHTYRNIRPVRVLYFDGMSAALSETGWLDSQQVLVRAANGTTRNPSMFDEYARARALCAWGEKFGVEGVVRMNSGFELLWCNFDSPSIQLVSHINITAPGSTPDDDIPPGPPPGVPRDPPGKDRPTAPDAPRRRGPRGGWSPFGSTGFTEWLRLAAQRGVVPQAHVLLDHASFVTFYHPRLHSLAPARSNQTMRQHRILPNISEADAQSVLQELAEVLERPPWRSRGSGMDWGSLARDIVETWAGRLVQLREFLGNASTALDAGSSLNTTETLAAVSRLTYSPLNPYMDTRKSSNSSAWDWFYDPGLPVSDDLEDLRPPHQRPPPPPHMPVPHPAANANVSALRRCMYSATGFLHDPRIPKTPQELLLQASVETVLQRLCTDYGDIFVESMDAPPDAALEDVKMLIAKWEARVVALMAWLDWTEWLRCEEVCSRDSVCTMPMWPVNMFGPGPRRGPGGGEDEPETPADWKPRCISLLPTERGGPTGRRFAEAEAFLIARGFDEEWE